MPILRGLLLIASLQLVGCVAIENPPEEKYQVYEKNLVGRFAFTDEDGQDHEFEISYDAENEPKYIYTNPEEFSDRNEGFNIYQIDNRYFLVLQIKTEPHVKQEYLLARLRFNRKGFSIRNLEDDFFRSNPDVLPGIKITEDHVHLESSSEQLTEFLREHGNDPELYVQGGRTYRRVDAKP